MSKKDDALKLALAALENHPGNYKLSKAECAEYRAVEDAIREALAEQPAQPSKPWVWLTDIERAEVQYKAHKKGLTPLEFMELHEAKMRKKNAAPCKPLTDDRIWELKTQFEKDAEMKIPEKPFRHVVRAIEAALGTKE